METPSKLACDFASSLNLPKWDPFHDPDIVDEMAPTQTVYTIKSKSLKIT